MWRIRRSVAVSDSVTMKPNETIRIDAAGTWSKAPSRSNGIPIQNHSGGLTSMMSR